jgi:D-alanine-D-alanine ligase
MDKVRSKQVWQTLGLPTAEYRVLRRPEDLSGLIDELGLPLFLKPSHEGSSVGVGKVNQADELKGVYAQAAAVGDEVLAEKFLCGAELTVAILADQPLPVVRMSAANEFYDYEAKYESDETQYFCPAGLDAELEMQVRELARHAFFALDCSSWGRVDIMLDESGKPVLLEVNPIPGMTDHSLVPMAAAAAGIDFDALVVKILEGSL